VKEQLKNKKMSETTQSELEDGVLIDLAAKGNSDAIHAIVVRHQAMVYRTCLRIIGNEVDAEDAAQATFLLFLKKCRKLKSDTILGGWLYRTAGFVSQEHIRNAARRKRREEKSHIMNENENEETTDVWNQLKPELDKALLALPEKHRNIVVLRYLEGKSNDEAAAILGMTPSAISTSLARSMEKLRGYFQRRGIVLSTLVLSAAFTKNVSAAAVPATLGSSIMTAAAGGAAATAVSASVALMVEGAVAKMAWIKAKVIALAGVLVTSGALLGIYGLQLSSEQIDVLDFTKEQTAKANAIMADHRAKYVALETQHVTSLREEPNMVQFEIAAFPDELEKLKESFWQDFDKICDDRQKRIARRYLVLENLFPFGEYPVHIQISYDGKQFVAQQTTTHPDGAHLESGDTTPNLDPRWKRFWGDRKDASGDLIDRVLTFGGGAIVAGDEALTLEGDQLVLSADFVETLNLQPDQTVRVNQILREMRMEYLTEEKKHINKVRTMENPDGTKHLVVPPFRSERKALDKKLWKKLGQVLDARQLRIAKTSNGLSDADSNLFDWGNATYTITIRKSAIGNEPAKYGYQYKIDIKIDGGYRGPNGTSGELPKQLPDKYLRLMAK
jgi:RNA polymerase sigma factor (sigma-70 family)